MSSGSIQVGNLTDTGGRSWANPQAGRVYSVYGTAPTLNTVGGGQHNAVYSNHGTEG